MKWWGRGLRRVPAESSDKAAVQPCGYKGFPVTKRRVTFKLTDTMRIPVHHLNVSTVP